MGTAIVGGSTAPRISEEYLSTFQSQTTTWEDTYQWYGKVVWNDGNG